MVSAPARHSRQTERNLLFGSTARVPACTPAAHSSDSCGLNALSVAPASHTVAAASACSQGRPVSASSRVSS